MVIIIIIVGGAVGLSAVFLPLALAFAFAFSIDGDGVPGTYNKVQQDASCFPSPETYETLLAWAEAMQKSSSGWSQDQAKDAIKKILKEHRVTQIEEGTSVKVLKGGSFHRLGPSSAVWLTPVLITDDMKTPCYVSKQVLEMTTFQWIRWKLS